MLLTETPVFLDYYFETSLRTMCCLIMIKSRTWWPNNVDTLTFEGNPLVTGGFSSPWAGNTDFLLSRGLESLATLKLGSSKMNQHCWRFHGSGVIAAPQIIGLISFCNGMHHEYFFRSPMCFRVPHLCSKIPKINNWTGEFATVIWCLHCFTISFGGDVRGKSGLR